MKSIDWLSLRTSRVVASIALVAFASACADDSENLSGPPADAAARKNAKITAANGNSGSSNSQSSASDYCISDPVTDGYNWSYTITRKPGAKAISHFIIDLNNCPVEGAPLLTIANFVSATVNGVSWPLADSEGNTGCDLGGTPSIVKFDDLPDAPVYVIQFTLTGAYHNFLTTPAWIKAGTSCHQYEIHAPCCL